MPGEAMPSSLDLRTHGQALQIVTGDAAVVGLDAHLPVGARLDVVGELAPGLGPGGAFRQAIVPMRMACGSPRAIEVIAIKTQSGKARIVVHRRMRSASSANSSLRERPAGHTSKDRVFGSRGIAPVLMVALMESVLLAQPRPTTPNRPAAQLYCSAEYADDLQALASRAREYERQSYSYCVRNVATYECLSLRLGRQRAHARASARCSHGTGFAYQQQPAARRCC